MRFEYNRETPLLIDCAALPADPADPSRKLFADGIPVEEGRLVRDELLGSSDGTADQRFSLLHRPIILRAYGLAQQVSPDLQLRTELAGVIESWTLQESLAFSRAGQRDYTVEVDEEDRAAVRFGDGALFGSIPPTGSRILATYRVGGGAAGNTAAHTIQTIADTPQLALAGGRVTNPAPATGGAERESIGHAVALAPGIFRSLKRAVTADDYRALALAFSGVGKVRAEATGWNTVTLYVAPESGGQVSDVLAANLLAYFEDKRPITTIIEVADVDYVPIYVTAVVGVNSYYAQAAVVEQARAAAGALLGFASVDFGQTIFLSKFYEAIESLPGVAFVTISEFRREGQPAGAIAEGGRLTLSPSELPVLPTDPAYAGVRVIAEGGF
ncbi:MAG: hypothetical protein HGA45_40715 [Chloroflexales bacterium]|nr:hypothetical protein [Chloroflexales bacterium]